MDDVSKDRRPAAKEAAAQVAQARAAKASVLALDDIDTLPPGIETLTRLETLSLCVAGDMDLSPLKALP